MAGAEILFSVPKLLIIVTQIVSIVNIIYSKKITRNGFIAVITLLYIFVISLIDSNIVASLVGLWGLSQYFSVIILQG